MPEKVPLVLIVDDEPDFREIFKVKLTAMGMRVETAVNGAEGVKRAKELKPDLVLMDVKMPVMDGAEALLAMHDDPDTKNIRVVFLTSLGDPREEMQELSNRFSRELGADGYLKKTENLDVLSDQIKGFLK
jgi:CheY-like chemotaxis protein